MNHQHHPNDPYDLPFELRQAAQNTANELRREVFYTEGGFLLVHDVNLLAVVAPWGEEITLKANEVMDFLSLNTIRTVDSVGGKSSFDSLDDRLSTKAGKAILKLISVYFDELRKVICKGRKGSVSVATQGIIAGIAAWLVNHLGIEMHAATPAATAILVALLVATKGTFCRLTEEQARASIEAAVKAKPKER